MRLFYQHKGNTEGVIMKKTKDFWLLFLCFYAQAAIGQSLTKQQMYADFDTLVATIARVSPHIPIKKDLWHYDALAEMQKRRQQIDTVTNDFSFFILLEKVLNLAQDMHTSSWELTGKMAEQDKIYRQRRNGFFRFSFGHKYIDGKYIVTSPFIVGNDTIEIGSEVTHFNGKTVDNYIQSHLDSRYGYVYDLKKKKFYGLGFFKNLETIFQDSLHIVFKNRKGQSKSYTIPTTQFTKFLPTKNTEGGDTTRVELWQNEKVLYIKLTKMDPDYLPYLQKEIWKQRENTANIDKIIIDFRGNSGGEDTTWQTLYSEILPDKISYPLKIDDLKNSRVNKGMIENAGLPALLQRDNTPFLEKYNFYTLTNSVQTIEPLSTSIKFKGKIFVLVENHYSSTGSALVVPNANPKDKFYSVGRKTGYFLGVGFSPIQFVLPHSGFRFRIAPSIEVSNAKNLKELMHDNIEIEIPDSIEELTIRANYNGSLHSKAYLLSHDPFIKTVMQF